MVNKQNNAPSYRFGIYEALPEAATLLRRGQRIKIQEQPFRLLITLLESAGRIVSREVLVKRLWPDNTFVGFDQSLGTAVTKLRQALGDDAENPRFIETVPRRGYRFIAPVSVVEEAPSAASKPSEFATTPLPPNTAPPPAAIRQLPWRWTALCFLAALLCLTGVLLRRYLLPKAHLAANDALVLADFNNSTGNMVFDDTLNGGLRIKLEESPFFNVLPERTVQAAAQQAGRPMADRIALDDARAACSALGAKAIVTGSIAAEASGYRIRLDALTCPAGNRLAEEKATAPSAESVLATLGAAADALRGDLGEPSASIRRFGTPMTQATTSSLSALRAFSVGERKRARGLDFETVGDYKLAVDLDPQFALAYARLGVIYSNANEDELGRNNYRKAFELRGNTTERERLYITSHYYSVVSGDIEKAVEVYTLWRQLYPQDLVAPNNLADLYEQLGQPEKSLDMARVALRINPNHAFPYAEFMQAAQRLGLYKEAKDVWHQAAARNLDSTVMLHMALFRIGVAEGDDALVQQQMNWAAGNPREGEFLNLMGWAKIASGHVREAQGYFHQAQKVALKNGLKEFGADIGEDLAQFEADLGYTRLARTEVRHSLELAPNDSNTLAFAALILADSGDLRPAEQLVRQVKTREPDNTIFVKMVLPMARSLASLHRNNPNEALQKMKIVEAYDFSRVTEMSPVYYHAQALLSAGRYNDAIIEFQRILDRRAICPVTPYIALAHLGLARSQSGAGNRERARAEYQQFFELWRAGDPDMPILREAHAEFSRLRQTVPIKPEKPASPGQHSRASRNNVVHYQAADFQSHFGNVAAL